MRCEEGFQTDGQMLSIAGSPFRLKPEAPHDDEASDPGSFSHASRFSPTRRMRGAMRACHLRDRRVV